jgi:hypothetical protein
LKTTEQKYYDDLWEKNRLEKVEKAKKEDAERKKRDGEMKATLDEYVGIHNKARIEAQEIEREEALKMVGIQKISISNFLDDRNRRDEESSCGTRETDES